MSKILFYYRDIPYNIYNLNCPSISLTEITSTTQTSLNKIYHTCFGNGLGETIQSLVGFTKDKGATILVTDAEDHSLFIISIIKNPKTECVELFNICKDLERKCFSGYYFINIVINNFICHNPLFQDYQHLRLAMLCRNPYLVPAFKTYCQLGFSVDQKTMPVSSLLDDYISMTRPLYQAQATNFHDQLQLLHKKCQYSQPELLNLLETIRHKKLQVDWNK